MWDNAGPLPVICRPLRLRYRVEVKNNEKEMLMGAELLELQQIFPVSLPQKNALLG